MNVQNLTGIKLTESLAMQPAASVSALCIAQPQSEYFAVGRLAQDQVGNVCYSHAICFIYGHFPLLTKVRDYSVRKSMSIEEVQKWLSASLGYEPES